MQNIKDIKNPNPPPLPPQARDVTGSPPKSRKDVLEDILGGHRTTSIRVATLLTLDRIRDRLVIISGLLTGIFLMLFAMLARDVVQGIITAFGG